MEPAQKSAKPTLKAETFLWPFIVAWTISGLILGAWGAVSLFTAPVLPPASDQELVAARREVINRPREPVGPAVRQAYISADQLAASELPLTYRERLERLLGDYAQPDEPDEATAGLHPEKEAARSWCIQALNHDGQTDSANLLARAEQGDAVAGLRVVASLERTIPTTPIAARRRIQCAALLYPHS